MKNIILTLLVTIAFPLFADQYVVEFDKVTKKQMSSYTLQDGETPKVSNDRCYVLVTAQEYALLGDSTKWDANTTAWLKTQVNVDKVNTAIATQNTKTVDEKIAELEAKVTALETAKETP